MISQSTYDLIQKNFKTRELARLTVVGRNEPVTVYEPMMPADYETRKEIFNTFNRGLDLFYKGDIGHSEKVFAEIQAHDPAAEAYAKKCQTLLNTELKDWHGNWVMKTK
jgi:adenylate cyclase